MSSEPAQMRESADQKPAGAGPARRERKSAGDHELMNTFVYDAVLWGFTVIMDLFFRDIYPRGSWRIPRKGPILFVAAPHANQFVDPLVLGGIIRREAHRRVSFLIAEKSMKRKFIGAVAKAVGAVPVARALDLTQPAPGRIFQPDAENDPLLIKGIGTSFQTNPLMKVGSVIVLPAIGKNAAASAEVGQIISATELRLVKPFAKSAKEQLAAERTPQETTITENQDSLEETPLLEDDENKIDTSDIGTKFKVGPKVDQSKVYKSVFDRINSGGCVGIFPEGGSHDRTELLPLKAGVAIMALGALAENPDSGLRIIPCGMNYFHAHKFRSRAVVEFGMPVEVPVELVDLYKKGERREAISKLLDLVYTSLESVTVTAPDYDTLLVIQAMRRLYKEELPTSLVVELNRRLLKGYSHFKHEKWMQSLVGDVRAYDTRLRQLNIKDNQVEYANLPFYKVFFLLLYRTAKLLVISTASLPGVVLFAPIFIMGKYISYIKSKEALAASTVKIQARDVIATWKILVSLGMAPMLYAFYTGILVFWYSQNRVQELLPGWLGVKGVAVVAPIIFISITYGALRFGEVGMDVFKSLRPLFVALNPVSSKTLVELRQTRNELSTRVTSLVQELKPAVFSDTEYNLMANKRLQEDLRRSAELTESEFPTLSHAAVAHEKQLPGNLSYTSLRDVSVFATPAQSRRESSTNIHGRDHPAVPEKDLSKLVRREMKHRRQLGKASMQLGSDSEDDEGDVNEG